MVVRDRPVAWAIKVTPPRCSVMASQAAQCRRIRSFINGRNRSNLRRTASRMAVRSIQYIRGNCCANSLNNYCPGPNLDLGPPARVRLHGKEDKWRTCPLWAETARQLQLLLQQRDP